jgi:hypothetical protein
VFAAIAEALGADTQQTVEFIQTVQRTAGHGRLKHILAAIAEHGARTPEEVIMKLPERVPKPPKQKALPKDDRFLPPQRYVWDPVTGSLEIWRRSKRK